MFSYNVNPEAAGPLCGKEPWPLRFHRHSFGVRCMNTLASSVVYNRFQFGTRKAGTYGEPFDSPSGPPQETDWRKFWSAGNIISTDDGKTFPGSVELEWVSLDGVSHQLSLDLDRVFPDRFILHRIDRSEVGEAWLETLSLDPVRPEILLELNDRTIRIYMRALIVTNIEMEPGNSLSRLRNDLIEVWEHEY